MYKESLYLSRACVLRRVLLLCVVVISPYDVEEEVDGRVEYDERVRDVVYVFQPLGPLGEHGAALLAGEVLPRLQGRRDQPPDVAGHEEGDDAERDPGEPILLLTHDGRSRLPRAEAAAGGRSSCGSSDSRILVV